MQVPDRFPKVELHLHLDCSLSYSLVSRLDPSITPARYEAEFVAPANCGGLAEFLTRAPRQVDLMQTGEALRLAVEDLFEQLAKDAVLYVEIRFAPLLHTARGLTPEQAIAAVDRATEACMENTGIEARLILCAVRHFSEAQSMATARLAEQFRGSRVVALDLAGDEAGFSLDAHIPAFRHAAEHNIHRTAHAGEASGPQSVWETLRRLRPERIGHGVRSIEDPVLVEHLQREGIHLEVCPTSNIQTCVCARYEYHPVDRLYRAGVELGINTDARTITNVTLNREYGQLCRHFDWGPRELLACNRASIRSAFAEDAVKRRIDAELLAQCALAIH